MRINQLPAHVQGAWANMPSGGDINYLFKLTPIGPTVRVRCEGWGQLCNDEAATMQAIYHIRNRRPYWWAVYVGWEATSDTEIVEPYMKRGGKAPSDFYARYDKHWKKTEPFGDDT